MPKWFENWLKTRRASHLLIAKLLHWQLKRHANKTANKTLKTYQKHKRTL